MGGRNIASLGAKMVRRLPVENVEGCVKWCNGTIQRELSQFILPRLGQVTNLDFQIPAGTKIKSKQFSAWNKIAFCLRFHSN